MIEKIINGINIDEEIKNALYEIHTQGPSSTLIFEKLAYIKNFHNEILSKYENKIVTAMGLFYKADKPKSMFEVVYEIFSDSIKEETGKSFTPTQASVYKEIRDNRFFSFSAPTSTGKSYLFRELIQETKGDIVIVVPSRALISEYYYEILHLVDKKTLILQFIENVNTENINRRVYIVTPERGSELFKYKEEFNIELILLDEAQISEEELRGMTFDAFVRRSDRVFPKAKKIFAHPFIDNPQAQLEKHGFKFNSASKNYNLHTVGKIFISKSNSSFSYFSPNVDCKHVPLNHDVVHDILSSNGTLLVYISKNKIYNGNFLLEFSKYIELCPTIKDKKAKKQIETLRNFIGASKEGLEKHSILVDLMDKGIVIHHGSMPLKARLIVEDFVKHGFARICFATSTLNQGINMPFDVVWVDNFNRMDAMTLKNLIGRSGRTTSKKSYLDYGYTIINKQNVSTFSRRFKQTINISNVSSLDAEISNVHEDLRDIIEAIKGDSYDPELHLTDSQVARIDSADIDLDVKYILDNLLIDDKPLTGKAYYDLKDSKRKKIKKSFKKIYVQHLRRQELNKAEAAVLSTAIPILLWHVQGKAFSEIVSLRHAFLSEKDKRRKIAAKFKKKYISADDAKRQISEIPIRYTPVPSSLPNSALRAAPLFDRGTSVNKIDYDIIVYDTYDYLDKVISLSLINPLCAALELFFIKTKDKRSISLKNYIRFGTNDDVEIWLLRYGFGFDEIEWIKEHVQDIGKPKIIFKESIYQLTEERLALIARYL